VFSLGERGRIDSSGEGARGEPRDSVEAHVALRGASLLVRRLGRCLSGSTATSSSNLREMPRGREIVVTRNGDADPERVYDTLADLGTHVEWGGRRQSRMARISTLDAPAGAATTGTRFTSVGGFPGWRLHEQHVVTEVARPRVFSFETETNAQPTRRGRPWTARFLHRYEIEPHGSGSRVTYRVVQDRIDDAPLRFRGILAPVSYATVRVIAKRGLRNLFAVARSRS
jgi:uncharacterized protein YndB with AHSA1/START domain